MLRRRKKAKKDKRSVLIAEIERLHPKFIRERDNNKCVVCGTTSNPTCGHLFSRVSRSTRWDIEEDGNCHCQCRNCNFRHEFDPYPFNEWYINKFGKDKWDALHRRHVSIKRHTIDELEQIKRSLINDTENK